MKMQRGSKHAQLLYILLLEDGRHEIACLEGGADVVYYPSLHFLLSGVKSQRKCGHVVVVAKEDGGNKNQEWLREYLHQGLTYLRLLGPGAHMR